MLIGKVFLHPLCQLSEADPGFPVGGGANLGGAPTYDFVKFSQKLHEIEKILGRWGGGGDPLGFATGYSRC